MKQKTSLRVLALIAAAAFIAMVTVNALANILPLNNMNTGELSDAIPNLFVPAGITFAIWGLIYLLLLVYSATFLATAFRHEPSPGWTMTDAIVFLVNALLNIAWIFAWHWQQIGLSLLVMFGILATLIMLEERNYKAFATLGEAGSNVKRLRRIMLRLPILVYLGWICVATIANITAWLVTIGQGGTGIVPIIWTIVVLAAGTAVALLLILRRKAYASAVVVLWSYLGIILKRADTDPEQTYAIIIAAALGMVVIITTMVVKLHPRKLKAS